MIDARDEPSDEVRACDSDDAAIVELIGQAIHEPFRAAWRQHDDEAWRPLRATMEQVVAVHEKILERLGPDLGTTRDTTEEGAPRTDEVLGRYRREVAGEVLEPLHVALQHAALASSLCRSLAEAEGRAQQAAAELPRLIRAPLSTLALRRRRDGVVTAIKTLFARALRPLLWRRETHDVPAADLARMHLNRVAGPWQAEAFRRTQQSYAAWLGQLERAWSDWMLVVLSPVFFKPPDAQAGAEQTSRHIEPVEEASAIFAAAEALEGELRSLLAGTAEASGLSIGEDQAHVELTLSVEVSAAGTFVGRGGPASASGGSALVECAEAAADWDEWSTEAAARLGLHRALLAANVGAEAIRDRLLRAWEEATTGIVASVLCDTGATLGSGLERLTRDDGVHVDLRRILEKEKERATEALRRLQGAIPHRASFSQSLVELSEEGVDALQALSHQMPETLTLHSIPEAGERVKQPKGRDRTIRPREASRQAFDVLRVERIRTASGVLAEAMERVQADVDELSEVVVYGFDAGIAELEGGDADASLRAVGLATDGLSRATDKIAAAPDVLSEALAVAQARATDEVDEGLAHLIQRVMADRMTRGLLDARSRLTGVLAEWWERSGRRLRHLGRLAYSKLLRAWRNLRRYLERGASALGIREEPGATTERSVRTLSSVESFVKTLPLVYQRLFAFEPVKDPQLLTGREKALEAALDVWEKWRAGEGESLIVIAPPGVGLSSFLNVLAVRISEEASEPVIRTFRARMRTEVELVARLGAWLGTDGVSDLDALADRILEREGQGRGAPGPRTAPDVMLLEGLEHLYLRAPGGVELMERFLTFMARTQFEICWIVAMTSSAWQLIQKRAPAFVSDLEHMALEPLTADDLRQTILDRHRRSGLPLRYVEPHAGRSLLRRRLRRLRGTDRHQQLLEADYFERLYRASLGSPRLALFLWLRSADFTVREGELHVQPPEALSFSFLEELDLTQSFALKAFLDHGTLTVDEYCEVARVTPEEGLHVFESLEGRHAIEPCADGDQGAPAEADPCEARFRVQPLVTGAVVAQLRARNILH